MHEETRIENTVVKQLFGDHARLRESAARRGRPGQAAIVLDGETLGSGPNFRDALRQALRRAGRTSTGIIRQASNMQVLL